MSAAQTEDMNLDITTRKILISGVSLSGWDRRRNEGDIVLNSTLDNTEA